MSLKQNYYGIGFEIISDFHQIKYLDDYAADGSGDVLKELK